MAANHASRGPQFTGMGGGGSGAMKG